MQETAISDFLRAHQDATQQVRVPKGTTVCLPGDICHNLVIVETLERVTDPATLISGDIISLGKLTDRLRFVQGGEGVSTAPLADTPPDRQPQI